MKKFSFKNMLLRFVIFVFSIFVVFVLSQILFLAVKHISVTDVNLLQMVIVVFLLFTVGDGIEKTLKDKFLK